MSDPADLGAFLDLGWLRLTRGIKDRLSAARHLTLATVSADGWPQARTVVLRAANRAERFVEIHTDTASAKVAALSVNPRAQLHFWDEEPRLQVRLFATCTRLSDAQAAKKWAQVPEMSRESYGKSPSQGSVLPHPFAYEVTRDAAAFTVLRFQIERIDLVELGDTHRRAEYSAIDQWTGQWLSP